MANSTIGTLIGYAEAKASIDRTTIGIPGCEETMLLYVGDRANREYYSKFIQGGGEPKTDRKSETGGTLAADTTLNGAITTASTSIILDSVTGYATSGAGAVWSDSNPDFIEYTGISTLTLTGATGIGYSHDDEDTFTVMYALPSNFESFRTSPDNPDGVMVNGIPYRHTTSSPVGNQFYVYDNGTTKYLLFPRDTTGRYDVNYNEGATALTTTASVVDTPIDDENFIVERIVEHIFNIIYGAGSTQGQIAKQDANKILLDALKRRNVGKRLRAGRSWGTGSGVRGIPLSEYHTSL
jgi:hypothetical protein